MNEMKIIKAKYLSGYKILFSDKTEREVKILKTSMHPKIKKYLDVDLFRNFKIVDAGPVKSFQMSLNIS